MAEGFFVLMGVTVGAICSYVATVNLEKRRSKELTKRLTESLIVEIEAHLRLFKSRGYLESLKNNMESLKSTDRKVTYQVLVPDNYGIM